MPDLPIPDAPEELTSDWLSAVLDTPVASVVVEPIDGGLIARTFRVKPSYTLGATSGAPTALIVKLPMADLGIRARNEARNFYSREVAFYQHHAPLMGASVPTCFAAMHEPASMRSMLVLEDGTTRPGMRVGDNVAGCSLREAVAASRGFARLHAQWWDDPRLLAEDWLPTPIEIGPGPGLAADELRALWAQLPNAHQQAAKPALRETVELLSTRMDRVCEETASAPWTLTHWDSRLDNLLIGSGTEPEVVTFDWHIVSRAQGARDLVQFAATTAIHGMSMEQAWPELTAAYYTALVAEGIAYSRADFDRAVRIAANQTVRTAVAVVARLDFTNERGPALAARFFDSANFVAEHLDLPGLLREEFPG